MAALDFAGMMRAGMQTLGLHPAQFWDLTPAELALMLGIEGGAGTMTRQRLEALLARFPDGGRQAGGRGTQGSPGPGDASGEMGG